MSAHRRGYLGGSPGVCGSVVTRTARRGLYVICTQHNTQAVRIVGQPLNRLPAICGFFVYGACIRTVPASGSPLYSPVHTGHIASGHVARLYLGMTSVVPGNHASRCPQPLMRPIMQLTTTPHYLSSALADRGVTVATVRPRHRCRGSGLPGRKCQAPFGVPRAGLESPF